MAGRYEGLSIFGADRIVGDVIAVAVLVAGHQGLQRSVFRYGDLVVVGWTAKERVGDHAENRYRADHYVPACQISRSGLVLGDDETREKDSKGAEDQTYGTGDEGRDGSGLLVLGLDVLGHEDPVGHVTHEVEDRCEVVAHEGRVGKQSLERSHHVAE